MKTPLLVLMFLLSFFVQAQADSETVPIKESFSDTFKFRLGGYLVSRNDTVLSATSSRLIGAKIHLQDDLGMDSKTRSFRFDGHYRFNDFHKVEFSYYNIRNNASKVVEKAFDFNGSTYDAMTKVDSNLDLHISKINYAYSFYHEEKVELALAAGVHLIGIKTGLNGEATKDGIDYYYAQESLKFLAPLPVVGFRLDYMVSPGFHVNAEFDYFGISYGDYKGMYSDILIATEYQFVDNWSAGVGFNLTALDIKVQSNALYEVEQNVTAFMAYITYHY